MQGAIPIFSRSLLHLYSLRAQLAALTLESCGQCQFLSRGRILLRQAFRRARAHSRCNAEALRTPSCRHPVLSHACRPAGAGSRSIMASVLPQQHEPSLAFDACHKAADAQHTVLTDYLSGRLAPHRRIYLIVLNWDLPACIVTLWQQASYRVCADGGANRLYSELPCLLPNMEPDAVRSQYLPDAIRGDLDSLQINVRAFYESSGVSIVDLSDDQDSTDLQKCVQHIEEIFIRPSTSDTTKCSSAERPISDAGNASVAGASCADVSSAAGAMEPCEHEILALGALGGRLDHTLSNLNTLYMFPHLAITLCGDGNIVRLLQPGSTHIRLDRRVQGPTCGLVPLVRPAVVTTRGLRYNCEALMLQIGGMISTSNVLEADEVMVTTDSPLLWSTELHEAITEVEGG